jgi:hypothetical protein
VSLAYVVFLFSIAFAAERRAAQRQKTAWSHVRRSTLVVEYLCTWTFYGAVGYAFDPGSNF